MRLGCANIRNFPDMTPEKVRADGKEMGSLCDIWGQQENDPGEDNPQVAQALGPDSAVAPPAPTSRSVQEGPLPVTGTRVLDMPFKPVLPLTPAPDGHRHHLRDPRPARRAAVRDRQRAASSRVYNGDLPAKDKARRTGQW